MNGLSSRKIRIGVDARLLSEPMTGIGRYLYEVLSRMVHSDYEWYLYSHKPIIIGEWSGKNIYLRTYNLKGRALRMFWAQMVLPYICNRDRVDIFWSPAHRIPLLLPQNIASVVTIHDLVWRHCGYSMRPLSKWLDSILMINAARRADAIIAVSKSTAIDLINEGPFFATKISVIHLGASKKLFQASSGNEKKINFSRPYYLFVGTLEPRKNLNRLLDAVSLLPNDLRNSADLLIVGGKGWGRVDIPKLIEKKRLSKNVKLMGYVNDLDLSHLYENALFLTMPSLYEGFGLPIVEAMAWGVPTLSSNRSSMPEVVGEAGVLIDPEDTQSITDGLTLLLQDISLREKLSKISLKRSLQFKWGTTANDTLKIFQTLAEKLHKNLPAEI
jgi:glycosyltransferase involved in cell wall biosynthesis